MQLVLHQGDYNSICEWVQNGSVDFGFANPVAVKGLETQLLRSDPFVAVLPKNHKLAVKSSVSLQELVTEPYLLLEEGNYSEPLEAFHNANIFPNIRLRMHDDYSIFLVILFS